MSCCQRNISYRRACWPRRRCEAVCDCAVHESQIHVWPPVAQMLSLGSLVAAKMRGCAMLSISSYRDFRDDEGGLWCYRLTTGVLWGMSLLPCRDGSVNLGGPVE